MVRVSLRTLRSRAEPESDERIKRLVEELEAIGLSLKATT
jgi:hypothetical protein